MRRLFKRSVHQFKYWIVTGFHNILFILFTSLMISYNTAIYYQTKQKFKKFQISYHMHKYTVGR